MRYRAALELLWFAAVLLSACDKRRAGLEIGDPVPQVSVADLEGRPVMLPKSVRGKVVLLRFWSVDCEFCEKEKLFVLESFYQKYKDRGFLPVAVNVSPVVKDDERFLRFKALTYPLLVDEYGAAARQFGIKALPAAVVFDEKGILRGKITGEAEPETLEKLFTTVLNKGDFDENTH